MASKLLFIYGPPASGKLTVAQELEKLTDFVVFHNHLTVNIAMLIYEYGSKDFHEYCEKLRVDFLLRAQKQNKNIICTFCYRPRKDTVGLIDLFKEHSELLFVQLVPSHEALLERVQKRSRNKFGKTLSKEMLRQVLSTEDYYQAIPEVNSLSIDNTKISARDVAEKIKKYYNL